MIDKVATTTCLNVIEQSVSKAQEESGEQQPSNASPGTKLSVDVEVDTVATVTCLDVIAQPVSKAQGEAGEQQPSNACQGAQQTSNAIESGAELSIDVKVDTVATVTCMDVIAQPVSTGGAR